MAEVADALGCREPEARERIREWADGQHALWSGPSRYAAAAHQVGMSDDEYLCGVAQSPGLASSAETTPPDS